MERIVCIGGVLVFDKKAVFLDRDGTLINAIWRPNFEKKITAPFNLEELNFAAKVHDVLEFLKIKGFMRIMITNQPDVAHGYMGKGMWQEIHDTVLQSLDLDDFYMCRHTTAAGCPCKKPSPLMLEVAACKWGIDLGRSFMVGDTDKDIDAGRAAGCRTILIRKPYNSEYNGMADFEVNELAGITKLLDHLESA